MCCRLSTEWTSLSSLDTALIRSNSSLWEAHLWHWMKSIGITLSEISTMRCLVTRAGVLQKLSSELGAKKMSLFIPFHRYSEKSKSKCVGITIETRPDYCLKRHLSSMLNYGCTRLEIGVQSVYEDVARDTNRYQTNDLHNLISPKGAHSAGSIRVVPGR